MYVFDSITLFILLPNAVLCTLISVVVLSEQRATKEKVSPSIFVAYITTVLACSLIYYSCNSCFQWHFDMPRTDLAAVIPSCINMGISLLIALPVLWYQQFKSSQSVFQIAFLTAAVMVTLPLIQSLLIGAGWSNQDLHTVRDLFRTAIAFSTLPLVLSGICLALRHRSNARAETHA